MNCRAATATAGLSSALVLAGVLASGWLFRDAVIDHSHLGVLKYSYSWGQPRWLQGDTNRDGHVDVQVRLGEWEIPIEYWEDRDFDGRFESHYEVLVDGSQRLELDRDGDGRRESVLVGPSVAEEYFREIGSVVAGRSESLTETTGLLLESRSWGRLAELRLRGDAAYLRGAPASSTPGLLRGIFR